MEGSMFYLVFWLLWVYLTFIVKRQNSWRLKLSVGILMMIILSPYNVKSAGFTLNMSALFLLVCAYITLNSEKTGMIFYFFVCSFIIMIAYVTFHLFELYDPVWLVFNKEWMLGIVIGYFAILLQKNLQGRLLIIIIGTIQGEMLYACILRRFYFPYLIGSFSFLDALSLMLLITISWSFIEYAASFSDSYFSAGHNNKQKSS